MSDHDDCPPTLPTGVDPNRCCDRKEGDFCYIHDGPPPGTWAFTARIMAEGDDSGFDWDRWKDEMKEFGYDD